MKSRTSLFAVIVVALTWVGCSSEFPEEPKADVVRTDDAIFIVDRTGKKWDVTHAVNQYGFVAEDFQFGLGPNAIKPINDPVMLLPGNGGYPRPDETFIVIATTIGDDSRAYRVSHMTRHEIANDAFGDVHVTVGW